MCREQCLIFLPPSPFLPTPLQSIDGIWSLKFAEYLFQHWAATQVLHRCLCLSERSHGTNSRETDHPFHEPLALGSLNRHTHWHIQICLLESHTNEAGLVHQKLTGCLLWKVGNNQDGVRVCWEPSFILGVVYYRTDANQYQMERESDVLDKAIQDLSCNDRTATCGTWSPESLARTWG